MNITYPDLPISRRRNDILAAMREHQVIVVVGETGSGKTTQLPKMAMELAGEARGRVGCTQPRRLAAASVSRRVAEELNCDLGGLVGYQVRFEEKAGPDTRLKFMTDGILLAETQHDPDLRQYHTLILDEAHERSLNIDFLLGYLRLLLDRRRDLRLVISSATLDAGGPVLSMHAPFEVVAKLDCYEMYRACRHSMTMRNFRLMWRVPWIGWILWTTAGMCLSSFPENAKYVRWRKNWKAGI